MRPRLLAGLCVALVSLLLLGLLAAMQALVERIR